MDWPFIENTNNFIVDYHLVCRRASDADCDACRPCVRPGCLGREPQVCKRASCTKAAGCLTSGYSKDERGPALLGPFLSQCLLVADMNRRFKFRTRSRFP